METKIRELLHSFEQDDISYIDLDETITEMLKAIIWLIDRQNNAQDLIDIKNALDKRNAKEHT